MEPDTQRPSRQRVVIVDDDCLIIETLRWMIEDLGYTVCGTASNADEALGVVKAKRPTVVLMDVRIRGGADGIDVARAIAREVPTPIIFITGSDDPLTLDRIQRVRPAAVLIKPVHIMTLSAAVRDALSGNRYGAAHAPATRSPRLSTDSIPQGRLALD